MQAAILATLVQGKVRAGWKKIQYRTPKCALPWCSQQPVGAQVNTVCTAVQHRQDTTCVTCNADSVLGIDSWHALAKRRTVHFAAAGSWQPRTHLVLILCFFLFIFQRLCFSSCTSSKDANVKYMSENRFESSWIVWQHGTQRVRWVTHLWVAPARQCIVKRKNQQKGVIWLSPMISNPRPHSSFARDLSARPFFAEAPT